MLFLTSLRGSSLSQWNPKAVAKGLHRSMNKVFGNGLDVFVPKTELKDGEDLSSAKLSPATVEERPLLTAVPASSKKTVYALICGVFVGTVWNCSTLSGKFFFYFDFLGYAAPVV